MDGFGCQETVEQAKMEKREAHTVQQTYMGTDCSLTKITLLTPEATNNIKTMYNLISLHFGRGGTQLYEDGCRSRCCCSS